MPYFTGSDKYKNAINEYNIRQEKCIKSQKMIRKKRHIINDMSQKLDVLDEEKDSSLIKKLNLKISKNMEYVRYLTKKNERLDY